MADEVMHLSKGINLRDIKSEMVFEFHIDSKESKHAKGNEIEEWFAELDEDKDTEDVMKSLQQSVDNLMLSSPEYLSFDELATRMVDCVASGDVKILILEEGNGPLVPVDAEVSMHYAAYWERESIPFDCSQTMNFGQPKNIRLGCGNLIPGLEIGLTTVRGPKARFHLLIEPNMAWGAKGILPRIRPERVLFVISLFDVTDTQAGIRFNDLPTEEQVKCEVTIKTVKSLHMQAKTLFAKKQYDKAIRNYQQSMSVMNLSRPVNDTEKNDLKDFRVKAYVNLALCYLKVGKPKHAQKMIDNLEYITDVDKHCKALFYYGRACEALLNPERALEYYKKALNLEPKNQEIGKALANLDAKCKQSAKKEKEMWQNALKCAPAKKENVVYDVDEAFQNGVREMCQDLAGTTEYTKIDLPSGLNRNEVKCLKAISSEYEGIEVYDDGEGKRRKISIVKKV